ncbi:hypothetical protein R0381_000233 [Jeongeupia wiesaeckerbachi]|uniref:hypothetical protein n=1 Tax=Jeongeupia wiesaeckerbachi TaxID=3051218 RepID=UPI003D80447A
MSEYKSPTLGEYVASTQKWREALEIPNWIDFDGQVEAANEALEDFKMSKPDKYKELLEDGEPWIAREAQRRRDAAPDPELIKAIRQQLSSIKLGTYLRATGKYGNAINPTIEQGELKSVDFDKGILVLHSTVYGNDISVQIDKIISIDDTHTGSGASGPAQTPDLRQVGSDWYRGDQKV